MSWVMAFTGLPDPIANGMLSITENRYVIFDFNEYYFVDRRNLYGSGLRLF